jgi:hypothetical protein
MNTRPEDPPAERHARRIGMTLIVLLIVWTIGAVTIGVARGLAEDANARSGVPPASADPSL